MRSDSLTRSSARSANTVSPSASAAATASAGISSIARSASSPAMCVPRRRDARTRTRPTGSPMRVARRARSRCSAPIARQRVEDAGARRVEAHVLDGHVAARRRSRAATNRNVADDRSPGMTIGIARSCPSQPRGSTTTAPSPRRRRSARPSRAACARCDRASAPARAAWSSPVGLQARQHERALRAARWRPADRRRCRPARRPRTRSGGKTSPGRAGSVRPSTVAPIRRSGSATRRIGRCVSEASPNSSRLERPPGEQAHRAAGSSCPSCRSRAAPPPRAGPSKPTPLNARLVAGDRDVDAQRAQRRRRRQVVAAPSQPARLDGAVRERAEQQRAVRDRLVARNAAGPAQRSRSPDRQQRFVGGSSLLHYHIRRVPRGCGVLRTRSDLAAASGCRACRLPAPRAASPPAPRACPRRCAGAREPAIPRPPRSCPRSTGREPEQHDHRLPRVDAQPFRSRWTPPRRRGRCCRTAPAPSRFRSAPRSRRAPIRRRPSGTAMTPAARARMPSVTVSASVTARRVPVRVERPPQLAERARRPRRRRSPMTASMAARTRWPSPCASVRGVTSATARPCPSHSALPRHCVADAPGVAARNAPPTRSPSKRPRATVSVLGAARRLGARDHHPLRLREHVVAEPRRRSSRSPSRLPCISACDQGDARSAARSTSINDSTSPGTTFHRSLSSGPVRGPRAFTPPAPSSRRSRPASAASTRERGTSHRGVTRRRRDRARLARDEQLLDPVRVAGRHRGAQLLHAARQRVDQRQHLGAVVEEDVAPHRRAGRGDARRVAQAGVGKPPEPLDDSGASCAQRRRQRIRRDVRQVAARPEHAVVQLRPSCAPARRPSRSTAARPSPPPARCFAASGRSRSACPRTAAGWRRRGRRARCRRSGGTAT